MALQPGLRPIQEDAPDVSRAFRSVPLQDAGIRPGSLAPQAAPVNTFARATTPIQDDNVQRIAQSLAGLSPALMRFSQAYEKDINGDVESSVNAKIMQAGSTAEAEKLIQTDPEMADGLGRAAGMRRLGQLMAAQALNEARTRYQTDFDRVHGSVAQLTADATKPYLDKYGHDATFRKQFVDDVTPGIARITSADAETKAQDAYNRTQDDQTKIFTAIVQNVKQR